MEYFERPYLLLLFFPLALLIILAIRKKKYFISLEGVWDRNELSTHTNLFYKPFSYISASISYIALGFLIYSAAGPGLKYSFLPDETLGVDIVIALDISGSMVNSYDFLPNNRLTVSKNLLKNFIMRRTQDRLGLVVFAGAAYLQSPLTSDRDALTQLIDEADDTSIDEQGTAIGDALMLSTYRLKNSQAKSKVIVLLTDGVSNTGKLDPLSASFASKAYKIKVYSIGIGKEAGQYEVNFDALNSISKETGGQFYRAESAEDLADVLNEIDSLEKDPLPKKPTQLSQTLFPDYVLIFILLMLLDTLLKIFPFKEAL
ncbi:MAG: VWA domain-containing protein [Leptospira sp.]|nr:VWA domain-containing protein [Leptospira sp.]